MVEDASQIENALLRLLFTYWNSRKLGRPCPRRADIDPTHIPRLLPHIYLVDVERQPALRFRIRLAGTYIEAAFRQFGAGRYLEDINLNGETENIVARYIECIETCTATLTRHVFVNEDMRQFDYQRLLLPLIVNDDSRVDMVLGGISFAAPLPTPRAALHNERRSPDLRVLN